MERERIQFVCERCGKAFDVGPELAGKKARCGQCGHYFRVPGGAKQKTAVGVSSSFEGLDEGVAVERAATPPPRPQRKSKDRSGDAVPLLGRLQQWWRETGRDTETGEMAYLRRASAALIGGGFCIGLVMPRTNIRLKAVPIEYHSTIGAILFIIGVGMTFYYLVRFPQRALRALCEWTIIIASVMAIGYYIIMPMVFNKGR